MYQLDFIASASFGLSGRFWPTPISCATEVYARSRCTTEVRFRLGADIQVEPIAGSLRPKAEMHLTQLAATKLSFKKSCISSVNDRKVAV